LEHLPIWPPESRQQQQSTLPPSRFGTKLPKTPRFNQLRKRYKHMGDDGLMSKFLFGKPGAPIWDRRLGIEIFYSRKKLLYAVLFIRKHGPEHLRQMAVCTENVIRVDDVTESLKLAE
jgi:hypothetical protein